MFRGGDLPVLFLFLFALAAQVDDIASSTRQSSGKPTERRLGRPHVRYWRLIRFGLKRPRHLDDPMNREASKSLTL